MLYHEVNDRSQYRSGSNYDQTEVFMKEASMETTLSIKVFSGRW
jgi:hypothetical protein